MSRVIDGRIFAVKRRISDLVSKEESSVKSKKISLSSLHKGSGVSRSSRHSSIVDQRVVIAGLQAEAEAKRKIQEAEIQAEIAKWESEAAYTRKIKEAQQKAELLELEERIAKAKAMEKVYEEEELKQDLALNKSDKEPSSADSIGSHSSKR